MHGNKPNKNSQFWSFFAATLAICFLLYSSLELQGDNHIQYAKLDSGNLNGDFKHCSCASCGMEITLIHSNENGNGIVFQYTIDATSEIEDNDLFFVENILCQPENGEPAFLSVRNISVNPVHLQTKFISQHFPLKIAPGNYTLSLNLRTINTGKSWHHSYSLKISEKNKIELLQNKKYVINNSFYRV